VADRPQAWQGNNLKRSKAKSAALRELGRRHPEELAALYKAELAKAGLKPVNRG